MQYQISGNMLKWFSKFKRVVFTNGQTGNLISHKVETCLDCLLMPELYVMYYQILWKLFEQFEIYKSCVYRQTDNLTFNKDEIYLDGLLVPEINVIHILWNSLEQFSRFMTIVFTDKRTNRQPDFLQGWDLSRWSSHAQNICNTKFCKNR